MASITLAQLQKDIKGGTPAPLYLLHGEEVHFIDQATALLEEGLLSEAEKGFNFTTFYGRDADAGTIIDTALRAPMMAPRQVVVVREAQQMRDIEKLLPYAQKPVPSTVLVLAHKYKKLPANRKLYKAIAKTGAVLEAKRIKEHQVADWVQQQVAATPYGVSPKAAQLLQAYLGADLSRVNGALEKLYLNLEEGQTIEPAHIERFIGISKDYNLFELHNALLKGDRSRAARIAAYLIDHPKENPLVLILGSLYTLFQKLYLTHFVGQANDRELASTLKVPPFAVRDYREGARFYPIERIERIFAYLQQADLRSKGVNNGSADHPALLRELVIKLAP